MPACTDCENLTIDKICRAGLSQSPMSQDLINANCHCGNYQQNVSVFIRNIIQEENIKTEGYNCWLSKSHIIFDKIQQLNPTKPNDDTVGFIAFNVPDKARMRIKTARFLTRKLNLNNGFLSDSAISSIANKINSKLFPDIRTELISGEQITEAYHKAIGSGSCMTQDCCSYTKLYEMNPDKIQMLVMYYMNDTARAILYKLDNGEYYLDRVYASCKGLEAKMDDYAYEQNWHRYGMVALLTTEQKENLTISDLHYEDGHVPYMDTFGGSIHKDKLTLSYNNCDLSLDSTCGYIEDGYVCEGCDEHISENDAISVGDYTYCEHCVDNSFTYCEYCGGYVDNDDIVYITDEDTCVCEYHASRDYTKCNDCGEWFNPEDIDEDGHCSECKPEEDKHIEHAGQLELSLEENE